MPIVASAAAFGQKSAANDAAWVHTAAAATLLCIRGPFRSERTIRMTLEALVFIADTPENRSINENDAVELIGKFGIAPGKVLIKIPSDDISPELKLHLRMNRDVAAWQLDDVTKLRRFDPLVLADVIELKRLGG
ncbi:hypothetical protein [Lysobacter capsici]|nr:hypothetical protein [Lysobacter capsici]